MSRRSTTLAASITFMWRSRPWGASWWTPPRGVRRLPWLVRRLHSVGTRTHRFWCRKIEDQQTERPHRLRAPYTTRLPPHLLSFDYGALRQDCSEQRYLDPVPRARRLPI